MAAIDGMKGALVSMLSDMKDDHLKQWDKENEESGTDLHSSMRDALESVSAITVRDDPDDAQSTCSDFQSAWDDYQEHLKERRQIEKAWALVIEHVKESK